MDGCTVRSGSSYRRVRSGSSYRRVLSGASYRTVVYYTVKADMWRHQSSCSLNPKGNENKSKAKKSAPASTGKLLLPTKTKTRGVYSIYIYKCKRCPSNEEYVNNHNQNYISNKLRELARLILSIRKITGTKVNLEYCITPCNREELLEGVRDIAGYDASIHKYAIPSLALKLGGSLFKCAKLLQATALIKSNDEKIKKAQEKEPEAAKEYTIYQFFYQLIEDGYSQSANNDHDRGMSILSTQSPTPVCSTCLPSGVLLP